MGASRALQRGVPLEPPLATHRRRSRSSAHLRRLQRTWVWVRCRAWVCSEQMSQSACHGQTRTLPFAARAYVGTFEETYGWKEPARRPSKAPGEWAGRREAPSVRGLPEGLVHTGLVQWAAHSLTHNLRSHPPGAWGRVRRCDAWRVRGESGMPIRVEYALCSRRDATS